MGERWKGVDRKGRVRYVAGANRHAAMIAWQWRFGYPNDNLERVER